MSITDTPPVGTGLRPPTLTLKGRPPPPRTPPTTFTPLPEQQGISRKQQEDFDLATALGLSAIGGSGSGGASNANAMQALRNQLKFGLESLGLDREQLGLGREGLGLSREEVALNRRDDLESVINNALQRGIYRSGIRIRNERRVNERADLAGERVDLAERGLDITGKRIDLSEEELRTRIDNALAGLRASAGANKSATLLAQADYERQRREYFAWLVDQSGGVFPTVGTEVHRRPGSPF